MEWRLSLNLLSNFTIYSDEWAEVNGRTFDIVLEDYSKTITLRSINDEGEVIALLNTWKLTYAYNYAKFLVKLLELLHDKSYDPTQLAEVIIQVQNEFTLRAMEMNPTAY